MKTVYIATWYSSANCGTCLQARALYEVVSKTYETKMLSYTRKYSPLSMHDWKIVAGKVVKKLNQKKTRKNVTLSITSERQERINRFVNQSFAIQNIPSGNERRRFERNAHCFLVGSDQLWNPYWFDEMYYLDFVNSSSKKKSYATSIGISNIPPKYARKMKSRLNSFSEITVREERAKTLLNDLLNREDIQVVIDPTLLLEAEDWKRIYHESDFAGVGSKYILCYFVGGISGHEDEIQKIQQELNCKAVVIPMKDKDREMKGADFVEAGPYEFLYLIDHAEYVCTDSFHAIAISITFHKLFSVMERKITAYGASQSSRIEEILNRYHLNDCLFIKSRSAVSNIDYNMVDSNILEERERSLSILADMLKNGGCKNA